MSTVPARTPGTGTSSGTEQVPGADVNPASRTADSTVDPAARTADAVVALVEPPSATEILEGAVATWRAALVEAAGGSTLADVELLGEAALDLSAAHPSGLAQLFAGRETRLSNLVREGAALSTARRRSRAVSARAASYAQRYGIAPTYLAIGVATWTERTTPDVATDDVAALAAITRAPAARPTDDDGADLTPEDASDAQQPRTVRAPVLLRPVTLHPRGSGESDYALELEPSVEVNPVLARALRSRGALLDPGSVARGTFTSAGFDPRSALDRITSLGAAVLEGFTLTERIVVGTFVHPGQVLVDDLDNLAGALGRHEVVAALAGIDDARLLLQNPLPEPVVGDREPGMERGVGDLDPAQQHVLDVVATGMHAFVDAPAGADVTGTLAALVADAAASGRTVLYVPGHRRAATALAAHLDALGVGDLLLDIAPDAGWRTATARRLLGAMTLEAPLVDAAHLQGLRADLVAQREVLRAYVDALHAPREPWGASAYDALQHLAMLTSTRPAPRTTVRLPADVARQMDAPARAALAADLVRAGELGAFAVRPSDTPWYGADLRTDADADVVRHRLDRLLESTLPGLVARTQEVADETGLVRATSLDAWAQQLRMLDGVRGALDVFQPLVFERTAADLVAATATKEWRAARGVEMGYWVRRRLRKQAKDMVRPGRPVADLHTALIDVQAQREIWQQHCPSGGWPRLPDGLGLIDEEYLAVRADIDALDEVLATTPAGADLASAGFADLLERLGRLRAGAEALITLPRRTTLLHHVRAAGLGELLDDLAQRRADPALAPAELDLAWWTTVFEQILTADPALAGYDGTALGAMSAQYAALDRAHVASLSRPVMSAVVGHVGGALRVHREQAEGLFAELVEERLTSVRDTVARYPDVARRLRPVLAASPMLVPQVLPPTRTVDLVVIDAAAHLPVEVALAAVARGRQVVVVGDARCASGSALRELSAVLPTVALHADASRRDPYLTTFLAGHGYAGVLSPTPLPQSGPLVHLDVVDGTGMPSERTGTVDSTREETERVVELVITHALTRSEESLAVVTPSPTHAENIREAVLAEVRDNPALAAFFDAARPEPFTVVDLANVAGLRREAVVLTLGYGRTPHRRILHRFGPISLPGGDALLLDALGATRHRLSVVACFGADDLDPERLRGPGARLLADLLAFAAERGAGGTPSADRPGSSAPRGDLPAGRVVDGAAGDPSADTSADTSVGTSAGTEGGTPDGGTSSNRPVSADAAEADRLVLDLAERLWRAGLTVEVDHGIAGGTRIPLAVGHPSLPDRMLVAVLTDDEAYVAEPSIRVRDRQVAERLARLGWSVVRVWSAAAFLDPQAEADRVVAAVLAAVPAPPSTPVAPTSVGTVGPDGDVVEPEGVGAVVATTSPAGGEGSVTVVDVQDVPAATPVPTAPSAPARPVTGAIPVWAPTGATPVVPEASVPAAPTGAVPQVASSTGTVATGSVPTVTGSVPAAPPATTGAVPLQGAFGFSTERRPDVRAGLPISAYSDDELDALVGWLVSDGQHRTRDELAAALRFELGITRRSYRIDTAVRAAIARAGV
ncbi:hypothetical protein [Cellulomonas soli]|uniref:Restriction endonuclease type II-like domain-containing protein n=1 Tax=Cellulomonas soli TaxID=931535 RepID=A0A512PGW9_9CELL|nr:hypothetical protein [Cellulomonas soli]NYI59662.1 hypothetical protein [Cellulomonas soli]GEP70456.1 hypothetical protein CSO01_31710 [Cellulomonas soli]